MRCPIEQGQIYQILTFPLCFLFFLFVFGLRELNLKSFVDQGISSFIPSDQRVKNILYPKLNCIFVNHDEDNVLKFLACFEFSLISTCISFCLKILDNVRFYLILSIFTELINLFYGQNAQVTNIWLCFQENSLTAVSSSFSLFYQLYMRRHFFFTTSLSENWYGDVCICVYTYSYGISKNIWVSI